MPLLCVFLSNSMVMVNGLTCLLRKQGKEGRAKRQGIGKSWKQREKRANASDI